MSKKKIDAEMAGHSYASRKKNETERRRAMTAEEMWEIVRDHERRVSEIPGTIFITPEDLEHLFSPETPYLQKLIAGISLMERDQVYQDENGKFQLKI